MHRPIVLPFHFPKCYCSTVNFVQHKFNNISLKFDMGSTLIMDFNKHQSSDKLFLVSFSFTRGRVGEKWSKHGKLGKYVPENSGRIYTPVKLWIRNLFNFEIFVWLPEVPFLDASIFQVSQDYPLLLHGPWLRNTLRMHRIRYISYFVWPVVNFSVVFPMLKSWRNIRWNSYSIEHSTLVSSSSRHSLQTFKERIKRR